LAFPRLIPYVGSSRLAAAKLSPSHNGPFP